MKEQMNEGEASPWSRVKSELASGNLVPLGAFLILAGQMIAFGAWLLAAISWGIIALLGRSFPALHGWDSLPEWLGEGGVMVFVVVFALMMLMPMRDAGKQGIWPFIDPEIEAERERAAQRKQDEERREWDEQRRKRAQEQAGADTRRAQQAAEAAARRADEARRRAEEAEAEARRKREASPSGGPMSRQTALEILELKEGATNAEIEKAFKRLMSAVHPDKGGSDYFAKQLNAARAVLLGK